jgi:phage tail sheath protein FI
MIEKAIDVSLQWAAFEPNEVLTRAKLRLALTSFLLALWQKGALMGDTATEAFFVKCDEENNPPSERGNGRLLAEVGVAPSRPFEFVILRVGRANNEFEITEVSSPAASGGMR